MYYALKKLKFVFKIAMLYDFVSLMIFLKSNEHSFLTWESFVVIGTIIFVK